MKNEVGEKIMAEFAALRPKTYNQLTNNNDENKAGIKKSILKTTAKIQK